MALLSTQTRSKTEVTCLQLPALEPPTGDSLTAVSPKFKWLMPLSDLVTTTNYSVSHLIVGWTLINTSQTSAQYPTFTYGLSVISACNFLDLKSSKSSTCLCYCQFEAWLCQIAIHSDLESPTIFTDYREFKITLPALSNPPTLLRCRTHYVLHCLV